jgi:hypothetical protein
LAAALAPNAADGVPSLVRPEVRAENALVETPLASYDAVFLCNVAQFTANEARILKTYLEGGGNLIFFLGDQVRADQYNAVLGGQGGPRLLPARLGPVLLSQSRLNPLDYAHPIVRPFERQELAGLLTTPVKRLFNLEVPEDSKAKKVLAVADGSPLIVEEPILRGRVILVATAASADPAWTAWPLWPSFVPVVQEMLSFVVRGQGDQRNLLVGETVGGTLPLSSADASFTVHEPNGHVEAGKVRGESDAALWAHGDTMQSGVYAVDFGPPLSRKETFAVNVDPVESDLAAISSDELRDAVWPGIEVHHQTTWQNLDTGPSSGAVIQRRNDLARMLLYAALALVFVETYLARRFGHYAPAKPS